MPDRSRSGAPFDPNGNLDDNSFPNSPRWSEDRSLVFDKLKNLQSINDRQLREIEFLKDGNNQIKITLASHEATTKSYRAIWSVIGGLLTALVAILTIMKFLQGK